MSAKTLTREPRHAIYVEVANLTELEKEGLSTLIAVLSDPAMEDIRGRFMSGELVLAIDGGEVALIERDQIAQEVAA